MMNMLQQRSAVNVFGFLKHIRTQRNFLVQTEDQYVFIHDALLEALDSGDTNVRAGWLAEYLHQLRSADVGVYPCHTLDRQYQVSHRDATERLSYVWFLMRTVTSRKPDASLFLLNSRRRVGKL